MCLAHRTLHHASMPGLLSIPQLYVRAVVRQCTEIDSSGQAWRRLCVTSEFAARQPVLYWACSYVQNTVIYAVVVLLSTIPVDLRLLSAAGQFSVIHISGECLHIPYHKASSNHSTEYEYCFKCLSVELQQSRSYRSTRWLS